MAESDPASSAVERLRVAADRAATDLIEALDAYWAARVRAAAKGPDAARVISHYRRKEVIFFFAAERLAEIILEERKVGAASLIEASMDVAASLICRSDISQAEKIHAAYRYAGAFLEGLLLDGDVDNVVRRRTGFDVGRMYDAIRIWTLRRRKVPTIEEIAVAFRCTEKMISRILRAGEPWNRND